HALFGKVSTRFRLDDAAVDDEVRPRVGIDDLRSVLRLQADLVQAPERRRLHAVHPYVREPHLQRLADLRLATERGERQEHCDGKQKKSGHRSQPMAWRIRRFFKTGIRSARFNPAFRKREMPDPLAPNRRNKPCTVARTASISSAPVRSYIRSSRRSPGSRPGSRSFRTAASARASCRPRLAPCPASG